MRAGVAALPLVAVVLGADVTDAVARPPGPPPLAFRNTTLDRPMHTIDVHMQAVEDVPVRIRISRQGRLIGSGGGEVHQGQTVIAVRIGPKALRRLRPGLHVALRIAYGAPDPLVVPNAVLEQGLDLTL